MKRWKRWNLSRCDKLRLRRCGRNERGKTIHTPRFRRLTLRSATDWSQRDQFYQSRV
jgi:hypothetical protein